MRKNIRSIEEKDDRIKKYWKVHIDPKSRRKYWYNMLTGHTTWDEPKNETTTIQELKPQLRDLVIQRRLTKALAGLRTMDRKKLSYGANRSHHQDVKKMPYDVDRSFQKMKIIKDSEGVFGTYSHRLMRGRVVIRIDLRRDHTFTYRQDRVGKNNHVIGNGKWSLVPASDDEESTQLRLEGRFIEEATGKVLTNQIRKYPFRVFKKEMKSKLSNTRSPRRNETLMERKAREIDSSSDTELAIKVAGNSTLQAMISEGKNESLMFALGLNSSSSSTK